MKTLASLLFILALFQPAVAQQAKIVTAAQVNGTWQYRSGVSQSGTSWSNTIKILALGKQRLKVEYSGLYTYALADGTKMANDGEGQSIARIQGNVGTFKPDEQGECLIMMKFESGKLQVKQQGACTFGLNVSLEGTYRRVSSRRPKFDFDELLAPNEKFE